MHHADHGAATAMPHHVGDLALFAASSLWACGVALYRMAPSWEIVPPLCFGAAALIRAIKSRPPKS